MRLCKSRIFKISSCCFCCACRISVFYLLQLPFQASVLRLLRLLLRLQFVTFFYGLLQRLFLRLALCLQLRPAVFQIFLPASSPVPA